MRTILMAAVLGLLGACTDGAGDDQTLDASTNHLEPLLNGTWTVTMNCLGTVPPAGDCASPLSAATSLTMVDDGSTVTLTWSTPSGPIVHVGERQLFCLAVPDGDDGGRTRPRYGLCPAMETDLSFVSASMRWLRSAPLPDGGWYDYWNMSGRH